MQNKARVSIGMPVFNGEKYLKESIDSILAQTYQDWELIISDNASTDSTQQICQEYAEKDRRIHYFRNEKNLGAPKNYNRVFKLSSTEYFKWAAYDDVLAPDYLQKCVNVLDKDSSVILCHCKTGRIDEHGKLVGYYNKGKLNRIGSQKPYERFGDLINLYYTTCPVFGVTRTRLFRKTQLHGSYIGADRNLLAEISLMGRIHEIPECLFFWRDHPDSYTSRYYVYDRTKTMDRLQKEMTWWSRNNWTSFPHWKNCIEYCKSVNRVKLKWSEKLLCYLQILKWIRKEGWHFMGNDVEMFLLHNSTFARRFLPFVLFNLRRTVFSIFKKMRR